MVLSDQNETAFRGVLERLMDERHRKNMQLACNANQDENGAVSSAQQLVQLMN